MIIRIFKKNRIQNKNFFVEPDEIFLDSKNLENFDTQQFEGRIEKPISKRVVYVTGFFFFIFISFFGFRLFHLQVNKGEAYFTRSENNKLNQEIIFADRGIIYDRKGVELAWNKKIIDTEIKDVAIETEEKTEPFAYSVRSYLYPGFSHVLGYVSSPSQDKSGKYWQANFIGKDGLEKQYGERIEGINGSKIVEVDARGKVHSENIVNSPQRGPDLKTSLDARIQQDLFNAIKKLAENHNFTGGAGVVMDIHNGEVLSLVSYPEYNGEVLSLGKDSTIINNYINDKRKVFLNRAVSGLYAPGSIVKPFFALAALMEGIISPEKSIFSSGSISIPNPYEPSKPTIFKDWKAHGWTDMREAIAVSSDVYFYSIGGGFDGQTGLGIARLEKYARMFNIGEKTGVDLPSEKSGVIPNPEWKAKNFKGEAWRVGNTYHTSIGQYGFQVTPLEMVRATSTLANGGTVVTPHLLLEDKDMENKISKITLDKDELKIIHEGMRMTVTEGTATALNVPYVKVAAKTGTAQIGVLKNRVNSWVIGFFPYENPKYAFTVMMESGPSNGVVGATSVVREVLDKMSVDNPGYFE
jgi:penicillin-binding protein 2